MYQIVQKSMKTEDYAVDLHRKITSKTTITAVLVVLSLILFVPVIIYHVVIVLAEKDIISVQAVEILYVLLNCLLSILPVISHLVGFIVWTIEVILNAKNIRRKGFRWYLFFDDPLLYRVELLIYSVVTVPLLISGSLIAASIFVEFYKEVHCLPDNCVTFHGLLNWFVKGFHLSPVTWALALTSGGGFAAIVEISRSRTTVSNEEVSEVEQNLKDDDVFDLLEMYCTREFSIENIQLYKRLLVIKQNQGVSHSSFQDLYKKFIVESGKYQVNVASSIRNSLAEINQSQDVPFVSFDTLQTLETAVLSNIADTFSRFCKTDEYQNLRAKKKIQQELMAQTYKLD